MPLLTAVQAFLGGMFLPKAKDAVESIIENFKDTVKVPESERLPAHIAALNAFLNTSSQSEQGKADGMRPQSTDLVFANIIELKNSEYRSHCDAHLEQLGIKAALLREQIIDYGGPNANDRQKLEQRLKETEKELKHWEDQRELDHEKDAKSKCKAVLHAYRAGFLEGRQILSMQGYSS